MRFNSARIAGTTSFRDASVPDIPTALRCLHLRAALVRLTFTRSPTRLDLRHADVDVVENESSSWPRRIELEHFSYRTLVSEKAVSAESRPDWLDRSSDRTYQPSTYAPLIAVYESVGDDKSMRRVALAGQCRRRKPLPLPGKAAGYFLDATVGYG